MNTIKISENTRIETMTAEELLMAQEVGSVATPDIQRPAGVWNAEQMAKLEDTISRGWGIGTISIVEILREGKEPLRLLVDGLQRVTALRNQRDAAAAAVDVSDAAIVAAQTAEEKAAAEDAAVTAAMRLDTLNGYPVAVSITTTSDPTTAAELFVRLNNGTPLSKIQRGTAGLKPDVLAWARSYVDLLPDPMPGKVSRDEAALIFAACAINKKKMTTNGPACVKVLSALPNADGLPAADEYAAAATAYVAAMEKAGNTHMLSAQYLIPYVLGSAAAEHTLTAEDWAKYLADLGRIKGQRVRTMSPARGKAETQEATRRKNAEDDNRLLWAQIDDDKSNAARATVARYSAVALGDLYARIQNQLAPGDRGFVTAVKNAKINQTASVAETAAAIEEMM